MIRPRVAMVSEHASPLAALGGPDSGGQNVYVASLANQLSRSGWDVTVHTRRDDRKLPRRVPLEGGGVVDHVVAGPPSRLPKDHLLPHMSTFGVELLRCWQAERPDVVHAHFWMSGLAAMIAARPLGIPVVQTFHALGSVKRRHQGLKDTSPAARVAIESWLARSVDTIVATCTDEVFELTRLGADRQHIVAVPCGVDVERFRPDGPAARRGRQPRVLWVGRLVERKGVDLLVRALVDVPDAELVVVGGPPRAHLANDPEVARLRQIAEEVGVANRIVWHGSVPQPELAAWYRSADVVVCTPWYEPFGIVPLEAMACGVPVIASAVGGLTDSVLDGVTGFHVPPHRADALASALQAVLGDSDLRQRLGSAGVTRVQQHYQWSRVADRVAGAYLDLAQRAPEPDLVSAQHR